MRANELTAAEIGGPAKRTPATSKYPPRWIGLPTRGRCPECGLSRPHFYQLIDEGKIRSACIRQPGAIRGRRLVYLPSVLEFLDKAADAETMRHKKPDGDRGADDAAQT